MSDESAATIRACTAYAAPRACCAHHLASQDAEDACGPITMAECDSIRRLAAQVYDAAPGATVGRLARGAMALALEHAAMDLDVHSVSPAAVMSADMAAMLGVNSRDFQAMLADARERVAAATSDDELSALAPELALLDHGWTRARRGKCRTWTRQAAIRCAIAHRKDVPPAWR